MEETLWLSTNTDLWWDEQLSFFEDLFWFVHGLAQPLLHTGNSCHHHFLNLLFFLFSIHLGEIIFDPHGWCSSYCICECIILTLSWHKFTFHCQKSFPFARFSKIIYHIMQFWPNLFKLFFHWLVFTLLSHILHINHQRPPQSPLLYSPWVCYNLYLIKKSS